MLMYFAGFCAVIALLASVMFAEVDDDEKMVWFSSSVSLGEGRERGNDGEMSWFSSLVSLGEGRGRGNDVKGDVAMCRCHLSNHVLVKDVISCISAECSWTSC